MSELLKSPRNAVTKTEVDWSGGRRGAKVDSPAAAPRAAMSPFTVAWMSLMAVALLSGCEAVGTIFKAGFWVGIVAVVAVIGLIVFGVTKLRA